MFDDISQANGCFRDTVLHLNTEKERLVCDNADEEHKHCGPFNLWLCVERKGHWMQQVKR